MKPKIIPVSPAAGGVQIGVSVTWMTHEGGTKFYQVFSMACSPPGSTVRKMTTLNHWGPLKSMTPPYVRPVNGGQTQLLAGNLAVQRIEEKKRRGYSIAGNKSLNITPLDPWLVETFGAVQAHQLLASLGLVGETGFDELDDPDKADAKPARKLPEPPRKMPESWGSW